ncbi:MAG: hypothetical protein LDL27_03440 [Desulfovibrio sp.]|nr:hypothetical protein [Desulfovibrio sp.]
MGLGNNPLKAPAEVRPDRLIRNTVPDATPEPDPPAHGAPARTAPQDTDPYAPPVSRDAEAPRGRPPRPKKGKHVKSFSLDDHLVQRLRAYAFHEEEKASAVVSRALHQYLAERGY